LNKERVSILGVRPEPEASSQDTEPYIEGEVVRRPSPPIIYSAWAEHEETPHSKKPEDYTAPSDEP